MHVAFAHLLVGADEELVDGDGIFECVDSLLEEGGVHIAHSQTVPAHFGVGVVFDKLAEEMFRLVEGAVFEEAIGEHI